MTDELTFVAYYYPGWHQGPWKPLDEWAVLDEARPVFPGHVPLDEPIAGRYDDTDPGVLRRQVAEAAEGGISAFSFFLYYGPDGYVLDQPTLVALRQVEEAPRPFSIGVTWCMRLPHQYFPIPRSDDSAPLASAEPRQVPASSSRTLGEVVPAELRTVSARTVCLLAHGRSTERRPTPTRSPALLLSREREPELREPLEHTDPSVAQILAFMQGLPANGPVEPAKLGLQELETRLALTGLLDVPLQAIIGLVRLAYDTEPASDHTDYALSLSIESFANVFAPAPAYVEPRDVGAIARLAQKGGGIDVFSDLVLADISQTLSVPARYAFSLRDIRAAIEAAASAGLPVMGM